MGQYPCNACKAMFGCGSASIRGKLDFIFSVSPASFIIYNVKHVCHATGDAQLANSQTKPAWGLAFTAQKPNNEFALSRSYRRTWVPANACEEKEMNPYSSLCDDFGVYVWLTSKMELPAGRETILHFFDSLQKTFPQMTDFDCRDNGEYVLEENREQGSYRWVTLETRRIS